MKKNIEGPALRVLLERLLSSTEINLAMDAVLEALKELVPHTTISYMISGDEGMQYNSMIYVYSREPVRKQYLSSIKNDLAELADELKNHVENAETISGQLAREMHYEFINSMFAENGLKDFSHFIAVPFQSKSSSSTRGLFHVALTDGQDFSRENFETVKNVLDFAANNLDKIKAMVFSEKEKFSELVQSMKAPVMMFDIKRTVVVANLEWEKICRFKDLNNIIRFFEEKDDKRDLGKRSSISRGIDDVLDKGYTYTVPRVLINGKYYEINISPVRGLGENTSGGVIIMHDISEATEIDRMKSKFVSLASHQLRTPITAIKLFVEMLGNETVGSLNEKQRDYVESIGLSVQRMVNLVNSLLSIAKLENGRSDINFESVNLVELLERVIEEFKKPLSEKKCAIEFKKPTKGAFSTSVDQLLLTEIIMNLLSNAINYSKPSQCQIETSLQENEEEYIISVKDHGIGIAPEERNQIFQKFYRSEEAVKTATDGNGLGLYICKMLTERLGGKIWFESKGKNMGTTFYISIPNKKIF